MSGRLAGPGRATELPVGVREGPSSSWSWFPESQGRVGSGQLLPTLRSERQDTVVRGLRAEGEPATTGYLESREVALGQISTFPWMCPEREGGGKALQTPLCPAAGALRAPGPRQGRRVLSTLPQEELGSGRPGCVPGVAALVAALGGGTQIFPQSLGAFSLCAGSANRFMYPEEVWFVTKQSPLKVKQESARVPKGPVAQGRGAVHAFSASRWRETSWQRAAAPLSGSLWGLLPPGEGRGLGWGRSLFGDGSPLPSPFQRSPRDAASLLRSSLPSEAADSSSGCSCPAVRLELGLRCPSGWRAGPPGSSPVASLAALWRGVGGGGSGRHRALVGIQVGDGRGKGWPRPWGEGRADPSSLPAPPASPRRVCQG